MPNEDKFTTLWGEALHAFQRSNGGLRDLNAGAFIDAMDAAKPVLMNEGSGFKSKSEVGTALAGCDIKDDRHRAAITEAACEVLVPRG